MAELCIIGAELGADVPYCIMGGSMLAEGLGEVLSRISPIKKTSIVLVKPNVGVSTKWVYQNLRLVDILERPDTEFLISLIQKGDLLTSGKNVVNVLETVTGEKYPMIQEMKEALVNKGAMGSIMSGSSSAVFGLFEDEAVALKAYEEISRDEWETFLTRTYSEE